MGPEYLEAIDNFEVVQRRVSLPSSIAFGGWLVTLAACYIIVAYAFWFGQSNSLAITTSYSYVITDIFVFFNPQVLNADYYLVLALAGWLQCQSSF
jgi:hypothetical protein